MVTRTTAWPAGTPCWVDLGTDVERATAFYSGLFGWRVEVGGPEFGGYGMCYLGDAPVAGVGPLQEGQTSAWVTYLATEDITATLAKATAAGGQVVVPEMQVADQGTMALVIDPTGAAFGLWQAGGHTGVDLANEPGAIVWNDHKSADFAKAKEFYAAVFGYSFQDLEGGFDYATVHLAADQERPIGGVGAIGAGEAPYWLTYFQVADTDAALVKVQELGGRVVEPPMDTPYGRQALVADDQGAIFAVITPPQG
ncbi:VOC family protein [Actinokineospora enzanensis]|uniref:VOC family protein n=1 Tax=Actinokineospora enzanensis TaxID=155975 RepID=UPI00035DA85E|nr:VOC family protein [Actinokineospora enzanensis]